MAEILISFRLVNEASAFLKALLVEVLGSRRYGQYVKAENNSL